MTDKKTKPKILCVDDEAPVLEALKRLLRKDFEVTLANNGEEGLEIIRKNDGFAIVLSDYRMPGLNGVDFLKQVKRLVPHSIRAILSGQMDSEQIANAINTAEIHRFILKPWDNEYLRIQMLEAAQSYQSNFEKEQFRQLSITDPITGLTNHRYFQERINLEMVNARDKDEKLGLILIDVDHFKSYNDRYGHPEGDRLLAAIADRLQTLSANQGVASRYGGEEFTVLLPKASLDITYKLAETIRLSLEKEPFVGPLGRPAYVTISLGVASFPKTAESCKQLINLADKALYQAKRQGRNQVVKA